MKSVYLFCLFIITAINMRVLALEQNKIGSLSVAKFADSSNNKLSFYENKGQIKNLSDGSNNSDVKFYLQNKDLNVYLLGSGIAYQFNHLIYPEGYNSDIKGLKSDEMEKQLELQSKVKLETYRMDMQLKGANPYAHITTEGRSSDYINYYNYDVLDVHSYSKIIYHDVYPKIDWVIYTNKSSVKYDFVVHPGGNPSMIQLEFKDQERIHLDELGNLIIENRLGKVIEQKPVSFQNEQVIGTEFILIDNVLRFNVREYLKKEELVIDPCLQWVTYYGGTSNDIGYSCVTDGSSNIYLCGYSSSTSGISSGGFQNSFGGGTDAYLVKFNSAGSRLWATYYGGTGNEYTYSTAIDNSGNVYFCGFSSSASGISFNGWQNTYNGGNDAFLVKFSSSGLRTWATYFGGTGNDAGNCCVSDLNGNVYLCGVTSSTTNISFGGYKNSYGGGTNDAFLVKFTSSGSRTWATYFGGLLNDQGKSCATDISGNIYMCGFTSSTTNISSGGFQNSFGGGTYDVFLVKMTSSGIRSWATYLGGTGDELGYCCVSDLNGNVYLCGETNSITKIASGGFQNSIGGGVDAFLVKFNSSGQRQWGSYYGGAGSDQFVSCSIDGLENVFLAGRTSSSSGLSYGGYQNSFGGGYDVLFTKFNLYGSRIWSTYLGGGGFDYAYSCFSPGNGLCYVAGGVNSSSGFSLNGFQGIYGGGGDAFLAKFNICVNNTVENISICNVYSRNNKKYFSSGIYYDTLKNIFKEDSLIVKLNLTIKKSTSNTINKTVCTRYFLNNKYIYASGVYYDKLINKVGCDSFLTINLVVIPEVRTNYNISNCRYYKWQNKFLTKPGVYIDTINSYTGCDSIVTINLQIKKYAYVNDTIFISNCNPIIWRNKLISNTNVYYDTTLQMLDNCDLIHVLFFARTPFNITQQPASKFINKNQLAEFYVFSQNPNSKYQWQGNNNMGSNWFNLFDAGPYSGSHSNTLKVKDVNGYLDARAYRCIVSDSNCNEISNVSSLNICPEIIQHPTERYNGLNAHVYYDIKVDFENVNFQWQVNVGSGYVNLQNNTLYNGVKTNRLDVFIQSKAQQNINFRCVVSSINCSDTSNEVKLHLLEKTYPNPCNSKSLSRVYPNPTNDCINLLVSSDLVGKEYKIVNDIGKEIVTSIITKEEFSISIKDFAAGIYFLRVGNEALDCFKIIKLDE